MPAISLARLKTQTVRLSEKFNDPGAFVRDLNELLDFYTNRTVRATQIASRLSLPTFNTPPPVLRQIQGELVQLIDANPTEAKALINALWKVGSIETRLLAAYLLGNIPMDQATPMLVRVPEWLSQSKDAVVRMALLTDAFARLRRENPQFLFILLEDWLKSPRHSSQIWGLQAIIPLLTDPQFENLPAVFRVLKPTFRSAGPITQVDILACLSTLEKASYTETVAFLRDLIHDNPPPMMLRTLRRILPGLSPDLRTTLREMLREQDIKA